MRILVCGSRDYGQNNKGDDRIVRSLLDGILLRKQREDGLLYSTTITIIQGDAKGADAIAKSWAMANEHQGVELESYPADWKNLPRWEAGPMRNQQMLDEGKPTVVFAFKHNFNWKLDKGGTEDMVRRAKLAGIPTYVID